MTDPYRCIINKGECTNKEEPCLWSDKCKDATGMSKSEFSDLSIIYLDIDIENCEIGEIKLSINTELNLISSKNQNFTINYKLHIGESSKFQISNFKSRVVINNLNIVLGTFESNQMSQLQINNATGNQGTFKSISSDSLIFGGNEIEFSNNFRPEFVDSNVLIKGRYVDDVKCSFKGGILSSFSRYQLFNQSILTIQNECQLNSTSTISTLYQIGNDPIKLMDNSKLIINGLFNCLNQNDICIYAYDNSEIKFQLTNNIDMEDDGEPININNYGLDLRVEKIYINDGVSIIIGGDDNANDMEYLSVYLSNIKSLNTNYTNTKLILNNVVADSTDKKYQLNDIESIDTITIESSTELTIKSSSLRNIHSSSKSKLTFIDCSFFFGSINSSSDQITISSNKDIYWSNINFTLNKDSSLVFKDIKDLLILKSNITSTNKDINVINTKILSLCNSTMYIGGNLISNNSFIQPTGQCQFYFIDLKNNYYYLNDKSKLEVDHSKFSSNFTINGNLIASSSDSTISLKQLTKLSPHLIVNGDLVLGGNLEIRFETGDEDLHAEYTILESNNVSNQFKSTQCFNGKQLIDSNTYSLLWRGKMCYLLNDVDLNRDFAKSTINGWSILLLLIILVIGLALFSFYRFYKNKNKFKSQPQLNKYEQLNQLEMIDLEKI